MSSGNSGRIYLREVSAGGYSLEEERGRRLAVPRVRASSDESNATYLPLSPDTSSSRVWWILGPGDERFLSQTLEVHFRELPPGVGNAPHAHQNAAIFYWLEGQGYDIHDGVRCDWGAGDAAFVPPDCVHEHVNSSDSERALALVIKAKTLWMYLGLVQQGSQHPWNSDQDEFGPRESWSQMLTPDLAHSAAVVHGRDLPWTRTDDGLMKLLSTAEHTDHQNTVVDLRAQHVAPGGHSSRHWHMADEFLFVLSGHGTVKQWDVDAEIADRYYARIRRESSDWPFGPGDLVYVPPNTVHQITAGADESVEFLTAQSRAFALAGYNNVVRFEPPSD